MKSGGFFRIVFLILFCSFAFNDVYAEVLTLPQGINLAVRNNRLIKIAKHEEAISGADTLIAKSPLFPSINASLSQTFLTYQPGAVFGYMSVPTSEKDFHSLSLSVQHILYDFSGNASRYEASRAVLKTKELDTARIRNIVALDFSLIYFDMLETEKLTSVAEREVQRLESHLKDARHLHDSGVITKNDLLQAEVKLSDARQKALSLKNMRAIHASRLNNALARPIKTDVHIIDIQENQAAISYNGVERAWDIALKQRPEMVIVDETMRAFNLEEKTKESEYYPKLFVRGSYDFTDNQYQVHEGNWALTLGMGINIFSGGSTKAGMLKIENQKLQLLEQKAKLEDGIRLEVERYYLDMENARERIKVTKDAAGQADENLRINRVKYKEGVGTATDVLDAVSLLSVADTNYHRAVYDLKRAEASLLYALGINLSEVYK